MEGLKYLHKKDIVHRDLKCANVLVNTEGQVKLSDFGSSTKLQSINVSSSGDESDRSETLPDREIKGSPYWMAPEVIKGEGAGKPSDVWSLGCCIIEMLTGKPPWIEYGKNASEIMQVIKTQTRPPTFPENISDECRDFLKYCFIIEVPKRVIVTELSTHPFVMVADPDTIKS